MPPSGSRAAEMSWTSEAVTKSLEAVPRAVFSLCHHSFCCPSGGYACASLQLIRFSLTLTGAGRFASVTGVMARLGVRWLLHGGSLQRADGRRVQSLYPSMRRSHNDAVCCGADSVLGTSATRCVRSASNV